MPIQFEDQSYDFPELVAFLKEKHPEIANPDAYAAELDIQQNGSCMAKNYVAKMLVASKIEVLEEFEGRKGHIIKTFLINATINYNGWMTTKDANERQSKNWLGMPGVRYWSDEFQRWDHPTYATKELAIQGQEDYRVATIFAVRWNDVTQSWEEYSIVEDDDVWQKILSGEIKYVSPSAWPDEVVPGLDNPLVVLDYTPLHYAFVDDPAFGFIIARVSGTCDGTTKKCIEELGPLVASVRTTIEKMIPKISLIPKSNNTDILQKTENEIALEKQVTQLNASINDLKEEVKTLQDEQISASKKDETNPKDDPTSKQVNASKIEDNEEFKQLKASNEKLNNIAKGAIIDKMLTAAKNFGVSDDELKSAKEYMLKASIEQLEGMDASVLGPLAKKLQLFQVSASSPKDDEFPDITQISASTKDDGTETDDDLLASIGATR